MAPRLRGHAYRVNHLVLQTRPVLPLTLAILLQLSPVPAAYAAAMLEGEGPRVAELLVGICYRESRCTAIGAHEIDAHLSRASWRGQVRLGHLDAECQPYQDGQWATRGAWGLNAADHWQWFPDCYRPEWLDVPLVSAVVAVRKHRRRCRGPKDERPGWCRARRRGPDLKVAR